MSRAARAIAFALTNALLTASVPACRDRSEAAPTEAELHATDARALARALADDEEVDRALHAADALSDDSAAAKLLELRALPAAARSLASARALAPATSWGRSRRDELISLVGDRQNEIPRYAAAIRSGDPALRLTALQRQIEIEKRALALAAMVKPPSR